MKFFSSLLSFPLLFLLFFFSFLLSKFQISNYCLNDQTMKIFTSLLILLIQGVFILNGKNIDSFLRKISSNLNNLKNFFSSNYKRCAQKTSVLLHELVAVQSGPGSVRARECGRRAVHACCVCVCTLGRERLAAALRME